MRTPEWRDQHWAKPLLTTPKDERRYRALYRLWDRLDDMGEPWESWSKEKRATLSDTHRGAKVYFAHESAKHLWEIMQEFQMAYNITSSFIEDRILDGRPRSKPRKRGASPAARRRAFKLVSGEEKEGRT